MQRCETLVQIPTANWLCATTTTCRPNHSAQRCCPGQQLQHKHKQQHQLADDATYRGIMQVLMDMTATTAVAAAAGRVKAVEKTSLQAAAAAVVMMAVMRTLLQQNIRAQLGGRVLHQGAGHGRFQLEAYNPAVLASCLRRQGLLQLPCSQALRQLQLQPQAALMVMKGVTLPAAQLCRIWRSPGFSGPVRF